MMTLGDAKNDLVKMFIVFGLRGVSSHFGIKAEEASWILWSRVEGVFRLDLEVAVTMEGRNDEECFSVLDRIARP